MSFPNFVSVLRCNKMMLTCMLISQTLPHASEDIQGKHFLTGCTFQTYLDHEYMNIFDIKCKSGTDL